MLKVFPKGTDVESLKLGAAFLNASVMQVRQQAPAGLTEPFANQWDEWGGAAAGPLPLSSSSRFGKYFGADR